MKKEKNIYLILGVITFFLFAFEVKTSKDDDHIFKQIDSKEINSLIVNTSANVYFIPSAETEVQIEGNDELIKNLEVVQANKVLTIQFKTIYNPVKLLKLAYLSREPLNIYISSPKAKSIELQNRDYFELSQYYESDASKMMVLKSPKLFTITKISGATCNSNPASLL